MTLVICVAALLLIVGGTPAVAQLQTTLDIGAGLAGAKGTGAGAVAQLGAEIRPPRSPVGLRFDGSYHHWADGFLNGLGDYRAVAATTSLVYHVPTRQVRPYVLAGGGVYALQGEHAQVGWTVGAGLEVPLRRYSLLGEVRGHLVNSQYNERLTPIIFGIRF